MSSLNDQFLGAVNDEFVLMLEQEVKRLEDYIRQEMEAHYTGYLPSIFHERTFNWEKSMDFEVNVVGDAIVATIFFEGDLAFHPSVIHPNDDSQKGDVPYLLEFGWHWHKSHTVVEFFTDFEGLNYLARACEKFSQSNPNGLLIQIDVDGIPVEIY